MNITTFIKSSLCAIVLMSASNTLFAANPETVTVNVEFVDPITISTNTNLSFDMITTAMVNLDTVSISTASVVGGTANMVISNTAPTAADLTVGATASQAITIAIGTITNNTGYTLGSFVCDYNATGSAACGAETSAASATLLIGATLTGDGNDAAGVVNGSFAVTITYD